jgi:hypothetical protein
MPCKLSAYTIYDHKYFPYLLLVVSLKRQKVNGFRIVVRFLEEQGLL